jgi:multidrug resistance efflux pump
MQRIRKRPQIDNQANQQRSDPVKWGRRVYLGLLGFITLAIINYLIGDAVVLRADGIVLSDRYSVGATYQGRVTNVLVREGAAVKAGDLIVELESSDMLKDIADLGNRKAELAIRETQLRLKRDTVAALIPLAERHATEARESVERIQAMAKHGLISAQRMNEALGSDYDTSARLAELRNQASMLGQELSLVEEAHRRAADALRQFEAFYARGAIRSPADGVVGARVPVPGQVVKFGDELLQINGRRTYVLAYLPDIYLFGVDVGKNVRIDGGATTARGRIEAILSVADALPPEFQNMFRPRDRSRLIRVSLPPEQGFAVSQKVRVGGCAFGWCWTL